MASLDDFGEKEDLPVCITSDDSFYDDFEANAFDDDNVLIGPVDFTGTVPRGQIRATYGNDLLAEFTIGFIDGDPTLGKVFCTLTGTQVRALHDTGVDMVYDIEMDGGDTNRRTLIGGTFKVSRDITRG